jgi:hypothetical protein
MGNSSCLLNVGVKMVDTNKKVFSGRFTVACDHCGKQVDWERIQILPVRNLCLKCLVYFSFPGKFYKWSFLKTIKEGNFEKKKECVVFGQIRWLVAQLNVRQEGGNLPP